MLLILSVDPGTARTGYCWNIMSDDRLWSTIDKGIVRITAPKYGELDEWLDTWGDKHPERFDRFFVLCEEYIQRNTGANGRPITDKWIKQGTASIFGSVHREAHRFRASFIRTRPANLSIGCRLAGIKHYQGHLPDDLSAEAHAAYFCVHGIPKPNPGWLK